METKYMKLTFIDGEGESAKTVRILPADVMRAERQAGSLEPTVALALAMAYFAAKREGIAGDDFDAWVDTLIGVEEVPSPKALALN